MTKSFLKDFALPQILLQELQRHTQAIRGDAMCGPFHHMGKGRKARRDQGIPSHSHAVKGNHRVLIAMNQQDRRLDQRLGLQPFRPQQPTRDEKSSIGRCLPSRVRTLL